MTVWLMGNSASPQLGTHTGLVMSHAQRFLRPGDCLPMNLRMAGPRNVSLTWRLLGVQGPPSHLSVAGGSLGAS